MPLYLSSSNRVESLQAQMAALLLRQPLSDPLQAEVILVPGMAMKHWLNVQLVAQHGVAANVDYQLPAAWIWQLAFLAHSENSASPLHDPLCRELATWKIYSVLPSLLHRSEFQPLQQYLLEDDNAIKRWQLSERIADVFDRYQYYRPEWIRLWSASEPGQVQGSCDIPPWQPILWRALIAACKTEHRIALVDRLIAVLHAGIPAQRLRAIVPSRICCFALSSLPPLFVQVLNALALHTDVYLFQHSPTPQYWADLRSQKAMARIRVEKPRTVDYYETGNELLASWGRQGQAFQDLLLGTDTLELAHWEEYPSPGTDTLLHRLQQDILDLQERKVELAPDGSVCITICHSPLRECQVLHDALLDALQKDPTLKPEDVLVMVPEISRYAPYVEAVFRRDDSGARPFIPWNLSDIAVADEHPLIRVFFQLLTLPAMRFSYSEITSLLEVPEIARQCGLDSAEKEELIILLQESAVRWGIDGAHKRELGLPAIEQNTWHHAIERLMAGYALGDMEFWNGIAPVAGVAGARAAATGRLCEFLDRLCHWRASLRQPHTGRQWQLVLNEFLLSIFGSVNDEDDKLQQIRDAIADFADQAGNEEVSSELLTLCLQESLGTRTVSNRFFSGGVTFCGMRPMRSLPFRVICVLGMNDLAFPRRESLLGFDAMARRWRAGDPRKGDEDRYLLLETLLCARDKLYFSYTGRSLKDNSACQPSVLLQELMDFIDARYFSSDNPSASMSSLISFSAPMQAFSWRNFVAGTSEKSGFLVSYDSRWRHVAQTMLMHKGSARRKTSARVDHAWPDTQIGSQQNPEDSIELSRLIKFLQHPVEFFFKNRLRIQLQKVREREDEEVFTLNGLQSWQVRSNMLTALLRDTADVVNHAGDATALAKLESILVARGHLPHGVMASGAYAQALQSAQSLLKKLEPYTGLQAQARRVDLYFDVEEEGAVAKMHLAGQVDSYLPGIGLLHYTPSSLKAKDFLKTWVEHLALCAGEQCQHDDKAALHCRDESVIFKPVAAVDALSRLHAYLLLYKEGLGRPLPILPEASFAYMMASDDRKRISAAGQKWKSDGYSDRKGDSDDSYIRLIARNNDADPVQNEEFAALAESLYAMAIAHRVMS